MEEKNIIRGPTVVADRNHDFLSTAEVPCVHACTEFGGPPSCCSQVLLKNPTKKVSGVDDGPKFHTPALKIWA